MTAIPNTRALAPQADQEDYTYHPHTIPGDPLYERLRIVNPKRLKAIMDEEALAFKFAEIYTNTLDEQYKARESNRRSKEKIQRMVESGEFERQFGKPYQSTQDRTLLGIDANTGATKRDVRNAYRRQARKMHPDKGGDAEQFKMLYTAYRKVLATAHN